MTKRCLQIVTTIDRFNTNRSYIQFFNFNFLIHEKNLTVSGADDAVVRLRLLLGCRGGGNSVPPVCSLTAPEDGAVIDLYDEVVVKGTASDSDGSIAKVALAIGGKVIPEITSTPFEYTLAVKDFGEGALKIRLSVEDDGGNTASDEISVTVQDQSQAPECKLTAPANGAELNVFAPFTIKGEGRAVSGEIAKVTLKINDTAIPEVTALPFEYSVPAETYPIGACSILLEVENSRGKIAKDEVSVTLADKNIAPVCKIAEPAAGTEFEQESAIVVKGTGSDEDGSIAKVVLKINDQVVESVSAVPFEYTLTDEQKQPGDAKIALEVTDNNGKTAADEVTIKVLGRFREFTDVRDGKTYKTVKIGTQMWFAENLAYLPQVYSPSDTSTSESRYYVYAYDGDDPAAAKQTESYKTRGVLYNWHAACGDKEAKASAVPSGVQGPCPAGWHLPSKAEWEILFDFVRKNIPDSEAVSVGAWDPGITVNGQKIAKNVNGHLRCADGWLLKSPDYETYPGLAVKGFDTYGLGIQATGILNYGYLSYGPGSGQEEYCYLWSAGYDSDPSYATSICITSYNYEPNLYTFTYFQQGYAVRCVQD